MRLLSKLTQGTLIGAASLLAVGQVGAAEPKTPPAKVERIEGQSVSRVILTQQAADRTGIEVTEIRDIALVRKRIVAGLATKPVATTTTVANAQTDVAAPIVFEQAIQRIEVHAVGELDRTARNRAAWVLPLNRTDEANGWPAEPSVLASQASGTGSDGPLIFEIRGEPSALAAPGPVLVELALSGNTVPRKVAPFDAVLYDVWGGTWVYTSPEPLVFVRQPVVVEYVDKGLAVLSEGPPGGTKIVSVGVAELFGTEFKIGK